MSDVHDLVRDVEAARAALIASVSTLTPEQAAFKPSLDEWSIIDNLEHLFLAEFSGVTKIWVAADEVRAGKKWTAELPNAGRHIEAIVDATWKSKEVAPPIATPHIGGPLSFWISATFSLTPVLADLEKKLDGLDLESVVFPHFLSGPLNARQRLEFLRFHIERHAGQIARIRERINFPAPHRA